MKATHVIYEYCYIFLKKKTAEGLKDLRNNAAFGLIIVNTLWIGLNFMFQLTEAAKVSIDYKIGDSDYKFEVSAIKKIKGIFH